MKWRARLRKATKWTATIVSALIILWWVPSGWYGWYIHGGRTIVSSGQGSIWLSYYNGGPQSFEAGLRKTGPQWDWSFAYGRWDSKRVAMTHWTIQSPLWIPFLLFAIPTALLWRRDHILTKRARANHCPKCEYDRVGLAATDPCPECGTHAA
jgi:hypothetical protein